MKLNQYELTVELGREELKDYLKKTEDEVTKDFQADGFRKGKVSRDLIRERVGDRVLLEGALDLAVKESLSVAVKKEGLEVMKISGLSIKENSASKLLYSVLVDVFPPVIIGSLSGLKVKRKDIDVEEKETEQTLDAILASRAKLVRKDTGAERGDKIEIDFEITSEDGLPIEGGVSKSHPVIIGDGKFMPGFEEQLLGLKTGEEKKFSLVAPADYLNKRIAGRNLKFLVRAVSVQAVNKPNLNDDFARSLGRFSKLDELKKSVAEGIAEDKKAKERQRLRLEILSQILKKSKVEVPDGMIGERLDEMITGFDDDLHRKGLELSIYLAHLQKTEDDLRKDWRAEAERQTAFTLILKKIAKEKKFNPSEEEVEKATNVMLQKMIVQGQVNQENLESVNMENLREAVAANLMSERTLDFLEKEYS